MPELTENERAAAILDRLPIVFQENHGDVFLAWVSQAIGDAEAVKQARIDELTVELEDAHDSIRQQGERYQAQCEDEDRLEEKCVRLEKEKHDAEAAQRERVEKAESERDLAIAHDRQPYPTAEAYEKVCAVLEVKTKELANAETAQRERDAQLIETCPGWGREIAAAIRENKQ